MSHYPHGGQLKVRSTPIKPPTEPLTDGIIIVRYRRVSDLDAIAAASQDAETRRWLNDAPTDPEASRTSMARTEEAWRTGQATPLVIADAATNNPVGLLNLQFRDDEIATVAYSVFPANRGQAIAPHAVQLLVNWAFSDLGLTQLFLEADARNAASIRVAEKCEFHRIGSRTEPDSTEGDPHTTIVFTRSAV